MKIYSKFKDYYDGLQYSMGESDPNIKYIRKLSTHKFETSYVLMNTLLPRVKEDKEYLTPFILGICGNFYKGYFLGDYISESNIEDFIFKGKRNVGVDIALGDPRIYLQELSKKTSPKLKYIIPYSYWGLSQYHKTDKEEYNHLFDEYNTPTFLVIDKHIIINPPLKHLKVPTLFDPLTMFNNIESYISERLIHHDDIKPLDDNSKIENHGFDKKTSFRNM